MSELTYCTWSGLTRIRICNPAGQVIVRQPGMIHSPPTTWTRSVLTNTASSVRPQNGARPKPFGLNLPTPVPGKPPPRPRSQLRTDLSNLQPADLTTSLVDTVERLQSKIYAPKFASPVPLTPTTVDPASSTQTGLVYDYESP